ncbi:hypothetical protein EHS25_007767 [Saitozyma podzolica]|uniref:Uncharacterized protein n=1 Tax=Saitozyma podzolica TaxID=1890683 RepID=A0A427YQN9_9TREE|nr:hypothetical protein EHS25_007767 [Saitozyma podzolica]
MSPAVCPYWTNWDDGWFTTSCECSSNSASIPTPLRGFIPRQDAVPFPPAATARHVERSAHVRSAYLDDAYTLEQLEQFQVDNLLSAVGSESCVLERARRIDETRRSPRNVASQDVRRHRLSDPCQGVTSEETDDKIMEAVGAVIHAFHYEIVSPLASGRDRDRGRELKQSLSDRRGRAIRRRLASALRAGREREGVWGLWSAMGRRVCVKPGVTRIPVV